MSFTLLSGKYQSVAKLYSTHSISDSLSAIYLISNLEELSSLIDAQQIEYAKNRFTSDITTVPINLYIRQLLFVHIPAKESNTVAITTEQYRKAGFECFQWLKKEKISEITLSTAAVDKEFSLAFLEGILLSEYTFVKYKTTKTDTFQLSVQVWSPTITTADLYEVENLSNSVCIARDLVNEPVITLTAEQLGVEIQQLGEKYGFDVEVLSKAKLESLRMGGLLAINLGSPNPPTFTILEHKPESPVNQNPIVLIGKGVVYDTGGLSLKPTPNSMDFMKCDMAGAAAVIGLFCAASTIKLPVHIIGLIPATENRPDGNAITPGDVVTMYNGTTVEIMNTDAEGRVILADTLSFSSKYNPELVIDLATLTGSAVAAIGTKGIVYMGTAATDTKEQLELAGMNCYERLVEFPLWDEYAKALESDIADIKNLGGSDSGAIVGGKFLEKFATAPWLHLDIAGMAFLHHADSYRGKNGTGIGVRLLYRFLKNYTKKTL